MTRATIWLGAFWYVMALGMFVGAGVFPTPAAAGNNKVVICHIPPGDPDNAHTIVVSEKAVPAHLSHGDLLGECSTPPGCDDGNACTIDTPIPGTQDCDYEPVDCDDGSACTTDSCDDINGCQNDETCATGDPCLIPFCNGQTGECDSAPVACESGYVCDVATGDCIPEPSLCGNGAPDAGEECDDGNNDDGDGCAGNCVVEFCGDGEVNNTIEECDDGNDVNGDGCENDCTVTILCPPPTCEELGMTDCGGECSYLTDEKHCGACFNACPTVEALGLVLVLPCNPLTLECDYECLPGLFECDGLVENGCESTDPNCGVGGGLCQVEPPGLVFNGTDYAGCLGLGDCVDEGDLLDPCVEDVLARATSCSASETAIAVSCFTALSTYCNPCLLEGFEADCISCVDAVEGEIGLLGCELYTVAECTLP